MNRYAGTCSECPLVVLEPDGAILSVNGPAAAMLAGKSSWVGRPSAHLAECPPWQGILGLSKRAMADQVAIDHVRDACGRSWEVRCCVLPNQPRMAVVLMARDITDLIKAQEALQRSQTMAQIGSIVSGVAHEVRNPLFAISSLIDAWSVRPHRDPQPFVDALRTEVHRLRWVMGDLLEYGRPPTDTRQLVSLRSVIDVAVAACVQGATARHVHVDVNLADEIRVLVDPRRMERVFINLIENAIQHTPEESVVGVTAAVSTDAPGQVEVTICDRGPGFAPDDLGRVFTPLFCRRPGGFGLGLAITQRIVIEHQGTVTAANGPMGGAVLSVRLPMLREDAVCDEGTRGYV